MDWAFPEIKRSPRKENMRILKKYPCTFFIGHFSVAKVKKTWEFQFSYCLEFRLFKDKIQAREFKEILTKIVLAFLVDAPLISGIAH